MAELVERAYGPSGVWPKLYLFEEYDYVPYSPERVSFTYLSPTLGPLDPWSLATARTRTGTLRVALPMDGAMGWRQREEADYGPSIGYYATWLMGPRSRFPSIWEFAVSPFYSRPDWVGSRIWSDLLLFRPALLHPTLGVMVPAPGVEWGLERGVASVGGYEVNVTIAEPPESQLMARRITGSLSLGGLRWWNSASQEWESDEGGTWWAW